MVRMNNVRIENGKIYGVEVEAAFTVLLPSGGNPQICPKVDMDGISVQRLFEIAWDAMKVKSRNSMKKLNEDQVIRTYHNKKITWHEMVSAQAASDLAALDSMTQDQLKAKMAEIQARIDAQKIENVHEDSELE